MSERLSGVVTRRRGGFRAGAARSLPDVSPVRAPIRHSGEPERSSTPAKASRSERSVSAASARIGVIQSTRIASSASAASLKASQAPNAIASVLPEPVVAWSSPDWPSAMSRHVSRWNGKIVQLWRANQASTAVPRSEDRAGDGAIGRPGVRPRWTLALSLFSGGAVLSRVNSSLETRTGGKRLASHG